MKSLLSKIAEIYPEVGGRYIGITNKPFTIIKVGSLYCVAVYDGEIERHAKSIENFNVNYKSI